jgi:superfamily II DNA or RNA helicase
MNLLEPPAPEVRLVFNGARTLVISDKRSVHNILTQNLVWTDKKIRRDNFIRKELMIKKRIGHKFVAVDPTKHCYQAPTEGCNVGVFPTGMLKRVYNLLRRQGRKIELLKEYRDSGIEEGLPFPDYAYEHQLKAVAAAEKEKRGIIRAPTGAGKTLMIQMLSGKYKTKKFLIIADKVNLFLDLHKKLEEYLGEEVGKVGDGHNTWCRVTVGIERTLALHAEGKLRSELETVEIILGDEAHHYGSECVQKVSEVAINTFMRIGFTATEERADGSDIVLEGFFGPVIYTVPEEEMIRLGITVPPVVKFVDLGGKGVHVNVDKLLSNQATTKIYNEGIVDNQARNNAACNIAQCFIYHEDERSGVLILVKLKRHGEAIEKELRRRGINALFIDGSLKGKKRTDVIDAYKKGGIRCLIATCILDEGADVARIKLVINLAGGAGQKEVIQRIGRGQRLDKESDKTHCIFVDMYDYLDIEDKENDTLLRHTSKRMNFIRERYPTRVSVVSEQKLREEFAGITDNK